MDLVQKSGVHSIDGLSKDQKRSIYRKCRDAIKYETCPEEMDINPKLKKHVVYLNVLARIELERAGLDEAKTRNPNGVSEEDLNATKANLDMAKLLIKNRLGYRAVKYEVGERKTCAENVSHAGDTHYKSNDDNIGRGSVR